MAEIARLDVLLGGDTSQFTSAMKVANDSLVNFAKTSKAAAQLQPFSNATAGALKAAGSIEQLKDVLAQLKIEQATVFNPVELQAYNNAIAVTITEIKALTSTESGAQSLGKSLTSGLSSVRQLAYILPGIGMAGLFNLAFEAISKAAIALNIFGGGVNKINKEFENFKTAKELKDFGNEEAKEIASLKILYAAATNVSNSMQIRNKAVDELQKKYPDYLKNISNEAILSGQAAAEIEKINGALIQKAYYEAATSKITDLAAKSLELDRQKGVLLEKQLETAVALNNEQKKIATNSDEKEQKGLNIFFLKGQYDALNKSLTQNAKDQEEVNNQIGLFANEAERFAAAKVSLDKNPITKQAGETIAKIMADLKAQLTGDDLLEKTLGVDKSSEKISEISNAIDRLLKIKVPPDSTIIAKLLGDISALSLNSTLKAFGAYIKKYFKEEPIKAPIDIQILPSVVTLAEFERGVKRQILANTGNLFKNSQGIKVPVKLLNDYEVDANYADLKKKTDAIVSVITNSMQDLTAGIGEAIGNIISGKKSPFGALFQILGEGIKALGKQLIVLGALGQAVQKALAALISNPALAVAVGIALEALGTIVVNKGVQLHAQGGIFTQPTQWGNHIIGEKGPEALVPLNRMGELGTGIGGGKQVIEVVGRISGNDLILIQNRAQVANNRAYGNNFNRRN